MTTHSLTCTHCGFRVQSENIEELTAVKRSCPICEKSTWELQERDSFPCSERERKFLYQKFLYVMHWCIKEKPCEAGGYCPLRKYCTHQNYETAFVRWIMEAEI